MSGLENQPIGRNVRISKRYNRRINGPGSFLSLTKIYKLCDVLQVSVPELWKGLISKAFLQMKKSFWKRIFESSIGTDGCFRIF